MNAHDVSVLGEDASLSGRIKGQDLMILGAFEGELMLTGRLHLGPKARVNAKVRAEAVEIEGAFEGEIRAKALAFAATAQARGLFLADRLGIRDGAVVEGAFNLAGESDARPAPRVEAQRIEPPKPEAPRVEAALSAPPVALLPPGNAEASAAPAPSAATPPAA
jgi:cytoskeletal protein CcmA (bactofilin family)